MKKKFINACNSIKEFFLDTIRFNVIGRAKQQVIHGKANLYDKLITEIWMYVEIFSYIVTSYIITLFVLELGKNIFISIALWISMIIVSQLVIAVGLVVLSIFVTMVVMIIKIITEKIKEMYSKMFSKEKVEIIISGKLINITV